MNLNEVNTALYREIKLSSEYDKYFEKVNCSSTFLGDGTTTVGLQLMSEWAKKFQYQTKDISKKLEGNTLQKTVNNVYKFLYQHIQYQADGYEQELKSPACSWKMRFTGIDCKSYSLFASTILSNLNIAHKFRKVVQPSAPDRWSHVYVVIDNKDQELVIDGANHFNKEVEYLQKHDMEIKDQKLPYYGMNSALSESSIDMNKAVKNFIIFLDELKIKHGLSQDVADQIKHDVKRHIDKGSEPKVHITKQYVQINQNRHYLNLLPSGLGFIDVNDSGGGLFKDLIDAVNIGSFIDRGFGQVFANGFDFSCWRASFPPSLAESETKSKVKEIFTTSNLLSVVSSQNLPQIKSVVNNVLGQLTFAVIDRKANVDRREGCTKKGEETSYKIFLEARNKVYQALENDYRVTYATKTRPIFFSFRGGSWTRNYPVKEIATISLKSQPINDSINPKPVGGTSGNSTTGKTSNSKILGTLATLIGSGVLLFK